MPGWRIAPAWGRRWGARAFLAVLLAVAEGSAIAQDAAGSLEARLARLEALNAEVVAQNRQLATDNERLRDQVERLDERYESLQTKLDSTSPRSLAPSLPAPAAPAVVFAPAATTAPVRRALGPRYDQGLIVMEDDEGAVPYQLKLNAWNQFRYTGFARANDEWTDSAGVTRVISNRNDFELVRGRLIFSGYIFDPKFGYYANLDYNTVQDDTVGFLAAWVHYKFNDWLDLHLGKGKVPGGREWWLATPYALGIDRTMATTFFRPSFSTGVWAIGRPNERLFYRGMVSNGFNTSGTGLRNLDTNMALGGDVSWDPLGPFGSSFSDLENHESPVLRLGMSGVSSRQSGQQQDAGQPEEAFIRLSDGTNLTEVGALGPDVTLNAYRVTLYGLDAGFKYRGLSLTGEYYLRWLDGFRTSAPIAFDSLFDHGFYGQAGYFVVPERVELYARTSHVTGQFGSGEEYGGGLNWFIQGKWGWRFTLEGLRVFSSPAQQIRTDYVAGASGTMIRAQLWTVF